MCGHFGIAGNGITKNHLRVLKQLGLVSMLRGVDSTGICQINSRREKPEIVLEKAATDYIAFCDYHTYDKNGNKNLMNTIVPDVFMGHVRAATIGHVDNENAHPFEFEKLIGAHNGTLNSAKYNKDKTKTDSEQLFSDINENGLVPVLNNLQKDDAYALVIFDKEKKSLFFTRSTHRTFWITISKTHSVVFWASEKWMLEGVLQRCGESHGEVYTLTPDKVYELPLKHIVKGKDDVFFVTTLEEKKEVPVVRRSGTFRSYDEYWQEMWSNWDEEEEKEKETKVKLVVEKPKFKSRVNITMCEECDRVMYPLDRFNGLEVTTDGDDEAHFICEECASILDSEEKTEQLVLIH